MNHHDEQLTTELKNIFKAAREVQPSHALTQKIVDQTPVTLSPVMRIPIIERFRHIFTIITPLFASLAVLTLMIYARPHPTKKSTSQITNPTKQTTSPTKTAQKKNNSITNEEVTAFTADYLDEILAEETFTVEQENAIAAALIPENNLLTNITTSYDVTQI